MATLTERFTLHQFMQEHNALGKCLNIHRMNEVQKNGKTVTFNAEVCGNTRTCHPKLCDECLRMEQEEHQETIENDVNE
jgi:hypothetical protein